MKASGEPSAVKLWQATNPKARDFRVDTIGRTWKDHLFQPENGRVGCKVDKPDSGLDRLFCRIDIPYGREVPAESHDCRSRGARHLAVSTFPAEALATAHRGVSASRINIVLECSCSVEVDLPQSMAKNSYDRTSILAQ